MKKIELPEFTGAKGLEVFESEDAYWFKMPESEVVVKLKKDFSTFKDAFQYFIGWSDSVDHEAFYRSHSDYFEREE